MEKAFDEGLMTVKEVDDLMDCQTVLRRVLRELKERKEHKELKERKELEEATEKKVAEQPKTNASVDSYASDTGSADMDLSEGDSQ